MKHALTAALAGLVLVRGSSARDLVGVYDDAVRNDQQIREADATRLAAREASPQALAALLPQVTGNWAISRTQSDSRTVEDFPSPADPSVPIAVPYELDGDTDQRGYDLQLQQMVFSWAGWKTLTRARKQVAQAEADYKAAQEDLVQRVATAYFNVLAAGDTLDANQAAFEAIGQQLEQANARFSAGVIEITDVKEAQAARDSAAAQVIDSRRQLANMEQALHEITDQDYASLAKPGDDMPLRAPQPADPERWVDSSMDQNLSLLSSRLAADIARDAVEISHAGHYPIVALTASRGDQSQQVNQDEAFGGPPVNLRYPFENTNNQIQLQVTVPIFSGGLTQSQVRQAQYLWIAAKDHVQRISRQTEHLARDAYTGVISEIARVTALRQGLDSAQVALKATETGYDAGTRTAVEVLISRQALVLAQTSYSQSRYDYLNDLIALQLAAGTLDRRTLQQIDQWLVATQQMPTSPVTRPAPGVPPQP